MTFGRITALSPEVECRRQCSRDRTPPTGIVLKAYGVSVASLRSGSSKGPPRLRRYTNLAATIHILRTRALTLLSPALWDDRNDAFYLARYKEQTRSSCVLALCFAEAPETYHHWSVFSSGSDGVCLEFDKGELLAALKQSEGIQAAKVRYSEIDTITKKPIRDSQLPFLKRYPYRDEKEFRLIFHSSAIEAEFHNLEFPIASLARVTLSPWMPQVLANSVKDTLRDIDGCASLNISRSTLVENERWKKAASPKLDLSGDAATK